MEEKFTYAYEGEMHMFTVRETHDYYWTITCHDPNFKKINEGPVINKGDSVTEALNKIGAVGP